MATRVRQSTAGPSSQRQTGTQLPPYEAPSFPLNPAAQRALAQLHHTHSLKKLEDSLVEAQGALSVAAGDINDRLTAKEDATKKRRAQIEQQSSQDAATGDDIEESLNELRGKVERMTQRMDESMRKIIDGQHSVQSIKESLAATANDARANASTQASIQQVRSQRRTRQTDEDDEDDTEYQDFTPTDPRGGTQAQRAPIEAFRSKIEDAKTRYQSHSLTARYAENNDYRDFRRVVHDAQHPQQDVALPHHSEWFREGQAPAPGVTTRSRTNADDEDDNDDDIAISRATISTKCPLTLQEFKDPLSSKKCPHSFENEAIVSMINSSASREPGRPNGQRMVQCPVTGCSQNLSRDDLYTDAVLIRQIKRIQRAKQIEEEEAEENDAPGNGRLSLNGATVIDDEDDDGADVDDIIDEPRTQMKAEPRASAGAAQPPSTAPRSTANVVELGSSDDEDETMED